MPKMKILPALTMFIIILWMSPGRGWTAESTQNGAWQGRIGLSALEFGYKEFSDNGALVDRERGGLPGLAAALTRTQGRWFATGEVSYFSGAARYRGQTQSGAPLNTRTEEKLLDIQMQTGRWYRLRGDIDWSVYAGLGYHRWQRDIKPIENVNGLFEIYNWGYGILGTKAFIYKSGKWEGGIDLRLNRTIFPKIRVDFKGIYDDAHLDLGGRFGTRLSLPWRYRFSQDTAFAFEPYMESWNLGRSPNKPLTQNGALAGHVFEPRSETHNYGMSVSVIRDF
jgi:hypothetical protein